MRSTLKRTGQCIGGVLALRYLLLFAFHRPVVGREQAFAHASAAVAKANGLLGIYTRQVFYKTLCAHVGEDVHFGFMTVFSKPDIRIGDRVYFGNFCQVGLAEIGNDCLIADGVRIPSGRHQHATCIRAKQGGADTACALDKCEPGMAIQYTRANGDSGAEGSFSRVIVGERAWIGTNAVVMAEVGQSAIVGAGAVVVKPVQPGERVGGVPARPLAREQARRAA